METNDPDHKGLGRLLYLNYFGKVEVESCIGIKLRKFTFNGGFKANKVKETEIDSQETSTKLKFSSYLKDRINEYSYVTPSCIKSALIDHFLPRLLLREIENRPLEIKITLKTEEPNPSKSFYSDTQTLTLKDIPKMERIDLKIDGASMFNDFHLYYRIEEDRAKREISTSVAVDGRTIPLKLVNTSQIPQGYEVAFILVSDFFKGKSDTSRQALSISAEDFVEVTKVFSEQIRNILNEKIPKIVERNEKTSEELAQSFPHLEGYFPDKAVGLIERNRALDSAQKKMFTDSKQILEADHLTESQYEKSLEVSARVLMVIFFAIINIHNNKFFAYMFSTKGLFQMIMKDC